MTVLLNPGQQSVPVHRPGAHDPAGTVPGSCLPRSCANSSVSPGVPGSSVQYPAARDASVLGAAHADRIDLSAVCSALVSCLQFLTLDIKYDVVVSVVCKLELEADTENAY